MNTAFDEEPDDEDDEDLESLFDESSLEMEGEEEELEEQEVVEGGDNASIYPEFEKEMSKVSDPEEELIEWGVNTSTNIQILYSNNVSMKEWMLLEENLLTKIFGTLDLRFSLRVWIEEIYFAQPMYLEILIQGPNTLCLCFGTPKLFQPTHRSRTPNQQRLFCTRWNPSTLYRMEFRTGSQVLLYQIKKNKLLIDWNYGSPIECITRISCVTSTNCLWKEI